MEVIWGVSTKPWHADNVGDFHMICYFCFIKIKACETFFDTIACVETIRSFEYAIRLVKFQLPKLY